MSNEYLLRHAQSEGNVLGILVSNPADGISGYGITELGRRQVRESLTKAAEKGFGKERKVVYICSPFSRALLSALEAQTIVDGIIVIDPRLSERWFGHFDRTPDLNLLQVIWPRDREDSNNTYGDVESPFHVARRGQAVRRDAQEVFPDYDKVYVTHGDIGQIIQAVAQGLQPGEHRNVDNLENGELRRIA